MAPLCNVRTFAEAFFFCYKTVLNVKNGGNMKKILSAALAAYPLLSAESALLVRKGETPDYASIVHSAAAGAPVTSVTPSVQVDTDKTGVRSVTLTAKSSLGNELVKKVDVIVYEGAEPLSALELVAEGSSSFAKREVSLCMGGEERAFADGIYIKANGTLSLHFDISGTGARYFSAKYGIDKSIRDNQPWGMYANATFRVYADGVLLFERSGVDWKTDYGAIAVLLPEGTRTLTLEVTDTSGQGGTGWGDCTLYA